MQSINCASFFENIFGDEIWLLPKLLIQVQKAISNNRHAGYSNWQFFNRYFTHMIKKYSVLIGVVISTALIMIAIWLTRAAPGLINIPLVLSGREVL
jgi:hypothetical protein